MELLIRSLKDCLKSSRWEEARYLVRFVSDLVNCLVISAGSLLQLLDNFVDASLEEGVPQVRIFLLVLKDSKFVLIVGYNGPAPSETGGTLLRGTNFPPCYRYDVIGLHTLYNLRYHG